MKVFGVLNPCLDPPWPREPGFCDPLGVVALRREMAKISVSVEVSETRGKLDSVEAKEADIAEMRAPVDEK